MDYSSHQSWKIWEILFQFFPVHSGTLNCMYIGPFNIASQVSNVLFFFCLILFASFWILLLCLHIY